MKNTLKLCKSGNMPRIAAKQIKMVMPRFPFPIGFDIKKHHMISHDYHMMEKHNMNVKQKHKVKHNMNIRVIGKGMQGETLLTIF